MASASASTVAAGGAAQAAPRHVSGLWRGEAAPAPTFAADTPRNPITWSLTLLADAALSAFGAGFFDDAGDIPGQPVLMYSLKGSWEPASGRVRLTKRYIDLPEGAAPTVDYDGRLGKAADGAWVLTGSWRNDAEGAAAAPLRATHALRRAGGARGGGRRAAGTHGEFGARLEEGGA